MTRPSGDTLRHRGETARKRARTSNSPDRDWAVAAFLREELAHGDVAVIDLEVKARAAGMLGHRQRITDAKRFKAVKKKLGINSRRDGFGRGGEWSWSLATQPNSSVAETLANLASNTPAPVVYGVDRPRPKRQASLEPSRPSRLENTLTETMPRCRVPPDWERGVKRLHHRRQHAGVPPHRWQLFVDDCAKFLDSHDGWAGRAAELGWDALALFGCDRNRPLDQPGAGLLWRLAGGRLLAIYKDWAVIAGTDGTQHVFHRRPATKNVTLPWLPR
jgi:hypothetical protein